MLSFKKKFYIFSLLAIFLIGIIYFLAEPKVNKKPFDTRPFICLYFNGQLGNHLFQTAAAISLALDNDCYLVSMRERRNAFYKLTKKLSLPKRKIRTSFYFKQPPPFSYEKIPFKPNMILDGYFESEKYFAKHKEIIKKLFAPPKEVRVYLKTKYRKIINHPKTVGIHVRTYYKDYIGNEETFYTDFHAPDVAYIEKAMKLFDKDSLFVVCSDHIEWCKKNLSHIDRKMIFIEKEKSYRDFYLLTMCKHMIMSNSTFSWWAAYLNNNPNKKIVVRTPWFKDPCKNDDEIILEDWIKIEGKKNIPIPQF